MSRKDILIIGLVILVAVAALVLTNRPAQPQSANMVVIYIGNREYKRVPLGKEQIVQVDQDDGKVNEVQIMKDGVYMHSSTCDNQDCVKQGHVTLSNYHSRVLGSWIVCLPNQVSLELVVDEDA